MMEEARVLEQRWGTTGHNQVAPHTMKLPPLLEFRADNPSDHGGKAYERWLLSGGPAPLPVSFNVCSVCSGSVTVIVPFFYNTLLSCYILETRCTMATHGCLSEFDSAREDWKSYVERLQLYFTANAVTDKDKQRAIFLSGSSSLSVSSLLSGGPAPLPGSFNVCSLCSGSVSVIVPFSYNTLLSYYTGGAERIYEVLPEESKSSYAVATKALGDRLKPAGQKALVSAQLL